MNKLDVQATVLLAGLLIFTGCGQSAPPAPPRVARPNPGGAPAPAAAALQNAAEGAKAKQAGKVDRAEQKSVAPANADPKTVFLVSQVGEKMVVEREEGILPGSQYEIAAADISANSTNYEILVAPPSTQSPQLVGTPQSNAGFTLPKGFSVVKSVGYSQEGLPLRIICEKTGTTLVLVPAGPAIIGCDDGPDYCKPSFKCRLDTFYMEQLEVTVEGYLKYYSEMKEKKKTPPSPTNLSDLPKTPVLGVPWKNALNYAVWAGMELPTEAEFEKAARGPNGLRTPWGDGKPLWYNRILTTTGAYPADTSPYGILDLAGNAKEWCMDIYSANGHKDAVKEGSTEMLSNYAGTKNSRTSNLRVVKGNAPDWSICYREGKEVSKGHPDVGFRCVLRLSKQTDKH